MNSWTILIAKIDGRRPEILIHQIGGKHEAKNTYDTEYDRSNHADPTPIIPPLMKRFVLYLSFVLFSFFHYILMWPSHKVQDNKQ